MKRQLFALLILVLSGTSTAIATEDLTLGQVLYLPVYSEIWHGDRVINNGRPVKKLVSALISIRNTSFKTPIRIFSASYYSTEGKLLKEYIPKPVIINPMGTYELFVERKESEGGSGANFVIQWDSTVMTNPPIVEALHADISSGSYALTFITTAHPIQAAK
jgi:hypothetical protein